MDKIFYLIKEITLVVILLIGLQFNESAVQIATPQVVIPKSAVQIAIESKIDLAREQTDFPKKIITVAESFINTPYSDTDLNDDSLVVRVDSLNCWTFVETTTAIVLSSTTKQADYNLFQHIVEKIRYRDGRNGYVSRIHYFLEWKKNLEKREVADDYTSFIGGVGIKKNLSIISKNAPDSLKSVLSTIEKNLSKDGFYYIPEDSIPSIENKLLDGDIVGFVSDRDDLDINHIGIIKKAGDKTFFIHCSSTDNKVVLSHQSLYEYLKIKKNKIGIIVLRLYKSNLE